MITGTAWIEAQTAMENRIESVIAILCSTQLDLKVDHSITKNLFFFLCDKFSVKTV
jgi:hypothetical protein